MWEDQIFKRGQAGINVALEGLTMVGERKAVLVEEGSEFCWFSWSVERLRTRYVLTQERGVVYSDERRRSKNTTIAYVPIQRRMRDTNV